ncbi:MAG: Cysteine-tRNA ligase [Parcubacteria group bacterium GW2011_GWF1_40_6]|uniref:Cysteine--tRNA ligase n=1 Tax=Candidatus Nomurabacteria bacterium RIFOXYB1_FULL_39_16 TaxID=1801803 RepID=A0A1F6YRS2_9BACT|nr:MAG: Cysteine-tRNA ligase [Parcubacteria group bacterium GW2011_GWF1_40_6]OGJ08990.1 MAG: cysteine--tRNA ligase [Candidatus Nomurabacteria bacterium RIFOXYB1_FULL_39_16]OGJ15269.1 MAG: cysteine--tRNA ligase [Candidatus Nomurabacteria bacterium RIFOXYD1_FULL_39_12]
MNSSKIKFYNTLTREKEIFVPINPPNVGFYSCGPTVYNYAHIGNLRAYVFADILQKTLEYEGYKVNRVMNLTDVGHLTSDADDGEDKMVKGLKREGKPYTIEGMKELAVFYTEKFMEDMVAMNIKSPNIIDYASDNIKEDVEIIQKLLEKDFAYKTSDGIYFEIAKFPDYWKLSGRKTGSEENTESRIGENKEKKNQADFVLWKFADKDGLGYETKLGKGFPGWHIECSAMSIKYLGEQFDIHTGGIDHIPVHHTNEIAQSECATGKKPFVRIWMHNEHIDMGGAKMAKSGDEFITLRTLIEKGINPLAYRFWLLMGHYRTKMNFNYEALEGAETALKRLYGLYLGLGNDTGQAHQEYQNKFKEYMEDDLDTPRALSLLWDVVKDENMSDADKKATILDFDKILGLGFENLKEEIIPTEILKLKDEREEARKNKDFQKSDELRDKINSLGYEVKDTSEGQKINKI